MPAPPSIFTSSLLWAPLPLFLLQILLILLVVRLLGKVLHSINQPMVIGEIIAGVILGPSVAGYIPGFTDTMFPDDSKEFLTLFSSVGLCFFMLFLGLEVDPVFMMQSWRSSLPIAFVSMSIPFGVGVAVASWLFTLEPDEQYNHLSFLLFIGTVFSFSAFPVLARILDSTKLISSPVGIQALGLAALEDVVAWCVLALIISYSSTGTPTTAPSGTPVPSASAWNSLVIFAVLVGFIALLMLVVRPVINFFYLRKIAREEDLNSDFIPYLFFGFLMCSWFTECLGVHAFFGAFLFGCILPKEGTLIPILAPRIELLIVHVFLPIYFANSGMKTRLQTLDSLGVWCYTFIVIALASVAKISSVTLASKLVLKIRKRRIRSYLEASDSESEDDEEEEENHVDLEGRHISPKKKRASIFVPPNYVSSQGSTTAGQTNGTSDGATDTIVQVASGLPVPSQRSKSINDNRPDLLAHSIENIDYSDDERSESDEEDDRTSNISSSPSSTNAPKLHQGHLPGSSASEKAQAAAATGHILPSDARKNGSQRNSIATGIGSLPNRPSSSGLHTPSSQSHLDRPSSHTNRTHAIPDLAPTVTIPDEEDQDEFGLDMRTGLPVVSEDEQMIEEFRMGSWKHCLTLGVLLNSRGLVALIVLNIGLDKGIIGPKIFSMMLVCSIVCTCLTSPIVYALYGHRWQRALLKMQASDLAEAVRLEEEGFQSFQLELAQQMLMKPGEVFRQDGGVGDGMDGYGGSLQGQAQSPVQIISHPQSQHAASLTPLQLDPTSSVIAALDPTLKQPLLSSPEPNSPRSPLQPAALPPTITPCSPLQQSILPPGALAAAQEVSPASRFRMKGRAASTMVGSSAALSIGGFQSLRNTSGNDSPPGSYIPPSLLARLRSSDSVESSAGTSPIEQSHMPFQPPPPGLGFGLSNRSSGSGPSTSRFGAPQLAMRAASPAPYGHAQSSMNLLSSSPSAASNVPPSSSGLQRRPSVFLLGSSPATGNNIPPMLGSTPTSAAGARSISTRNLLSQPSPLHQRSHSRTLSRSESRSDSGRNTPRAPATPRGGNGTNSTFGPGTPRMSAASSRHVSTSGIGILNTNSGIPTSPLSGGSQGSAQRMGPRSFSPYSNVGMSHTPVSPGFMQQQHPPQLSLSSQSSTSGAAATSSIVQVESPTSPSGETSSSMNKELTDDGQIAMGRMKQEEQRM